MSRIQELADLIRVGPGTVTVPSDKELYAYWDKFLRPQPLIDNSEIEAAIIVACRNFRNRKVERVVTAPSAPEPIVKVRPGVQPGVEPNSELEFDLGVIAAWKSAQLQECCRVLNLEFQDHPTNKGLVAMRARNAIANWLKRGNRLPAP